MHHLMKALRDSRLRSVACQPPDRGSPPNARRVGTTQHMSSSLDGPHPLESRMPAEMKLGANLYFPWACLAPTSKSRAGAEKEPVGTFRRKRQLGRRCLLTLSPQTMQCSEHESLKFSPLPFSHAESQAAPRKKARTSHMQGNLHVWFWPGTPVYCTNMCRSL